MTQSIQRLKDYLIACPEGTRENITDLVEQLYWYCAEDTAMETQAIKDGFNKLDACLRSLGFREYDMVWGIASELCIEHGYAAFRTGMRVGAQLMKEWDAS